MDEPTLARVWLEYSDGCFCDRPRPLVSRVTPYHPQFRFRSAVHSIARQCGLRELRFGKGKTATALLPLACEHRREQAVRFEWGLA